MGAAGDDGPVVGGRGRLHTLDGMRGVAALAVVGFHYGLKGGLYVPEGYLAVDLFFGLSGFVIAMRYGPRLAGGLSPRRFVAERLVRLYPLYLLGLLLGGVHHLAGGLLHLSRGLPLGGFAYAAAVNAAMLPVVGFDAPYPLNGSSWSLGLELALNLLFAAGAWRLPNRALAIVAVASAAALVPLVAAPDYLNLGWAWSNLPGGVARALFAYPIGTLLWRRLDGRARRRGWPGLLPLAGLAVVLALPVPAAWHAGYDLAVALVLFPPLLLAGVLWEAPPAAWPALAALGDMSYAVYAIHYPLIAALPPLFGRLRLSGPVATLAAMALVALLAAASAHWIDRPVRRRLSRALAVRESAPPQRL